MTYVTLVDTPIPQAVRLFQDLVGFENLTFLVMEPARQIYPDLLDAVRSVLSGLALKKIDMVFVPRDVGQILRRIPEDAQAVVLTAQPQLASGEFEKLMAFLAEAKVPSLTLGPEEELAAGVLFGIKTKDELPLVAKRVADHVKRIAAGEDAGRMPVQLGVEETLLFNHAVAGAIGFDIEKAVARQAAAAQQVASAAGPSVSPVVDETEDPQLRTGGPALTAEEAQKRQAALVDGVRKAIIQTSSYSAFDSISFKVEGVNKVVLLGYAMDPSVKSEIERRVKRIEEAEEVVNLIEVLPNSPNDDRIRARAYAAIYGHPTLRRYAPGGGITRMDARNYLQDLQFGLRSAQITKGPHPIHILVKDGHLALVGTVGSEMDKQVAEVQVQTLSGVFSVQNHLQVGS